MAATTAKDLRDMDNDLLVDTVKQAREELFGLRFRHATGELENSAGLAVAKRNLARALTVAREREIDLERELSRA